MLSHETRQAIDKIESCLEVVGSAMEYLLTPERNLFSREGHDDFSNTLKELFSLTNNVKLCIAFNERVTFGVPLQNEVQTTYSVLTLPDYNDCSNEWDVVTKEKIAIEPDYAARLENETHWRVSYGKSLIEYVLGSTNHSTSMAQLNKANKESKANFKEVYNFIMDMSPRASIVAYYGNSVVELVLKENFDEMEIITHEG